MGGTSEILAPPLAQHEGLTPDGLRAMANAVERVAVPEQGDAREAILAAAADCFCEQGFAAASIDDVAHALSATKGMVYHHFRSKTDLFLSVYERGMDINARAVRPQREAHHEMPTQRLAAMGFSHAVAMMAHRAYQRVLLQGVTMHQTGATTAVQRDTLAQLMEVRDDYEAMFRQAVAACEPPEETDFATRSFLTVLNGPVFWYSPQDEDAVGERRTIAARITTMAMRSLGLAVPDALRTLGGYGDG